MKKLICLAALMWTNGVLAQSNSIFFIEADLEKAVRDELRLQAGDPITHSNIALITNLWASSYSSSGISNFTGLEFATNLQFIGATVLPTVDFGPLATLPKLEFAGITSSAEDLPPLLLLTNLTVLGLNQPNVTNLPVLAAHPNLRSLSFREMGVTNAEVFSLFTRLDELNLNYNQIRDVSPLLALSNLTRLDLRGNPLTNAFLLGQKTNLTSLILADVRLDSFDFLTNLVELRVLYLANSPMRSLRPIAGATNLFILWVESAHVQDLSPLSRMVNLETLYMPDNWITNISALSNCPLAWLDLTGNFLFDTNRNIAEESLLVANQIVDRGGQVVIGPQAIWGTIKLSVVRGADETQLRVEQQPANLLYQLESSDDGIHWTDVWTFARGGDVVTVPNDVPHRFFRTRLNWRLWLQAAGD